MLQKVAHRDSQLKSQLAPVKEFFAYRTPAAKKAHPKQKGKKQKLAQENATTAQAAAETSTASAPTSSPSSANTAPTTAGAPAPVTSNVATSHVP